MLWINWQTLSVYRAVLYCPSKHMRHEHHEGMDYASFPSSFWGDFIVLYDHKTLIEIVGKKIWQNIVFRVLVQRWNHSQLKVLFFFSLMQPKMLKWFPGNCLDCSITSYDARTRRQRRQKSSWIKATCLKNHNLSSTVTDHYQKTPVYFITLLPDESKTGAIDDWEETHTNYLRYSLVSAYFQT